MGTLAAKLRLSKMTVSRALRNASGISERTRQRVLAAAKRLNYHPDPSLAVLNLYRHGKRTAPVREKIAFLTNFSTPDGWHYASTFVRVFEGARRRGRQLGYEIEPFWLAAPGLTSQRASRILFARGVRGVIVGPLAKGRTTLSLDWHLFSAVAVGRSLSSPEISTVATNHGYVVELAWREVVHRGYRRIGLAITRGEDVRIAGSLRASFLLQQEQGELPKLPIFLTPDFSADAIAAWAKENRPDIILSSEQTHYDLLASLPCGSSLPRFVHLNVDPSTDQAGIDQCHDHVGEHAAALLHLKVIQRETGVPERRDLLLINGAWKEGRGEKWTV